jgi:acyl-[acyl-carrier-protein]-phospholipid O-acyltransferase/long-chain-fatty-acid--[acyl-carrier-protein] ligase
MGATYLTLLPLYVKDVLQVSENIMTILLAAFSIGVALGAMLCARLTKGKITTKYVPLSAIGMALFGVHLSFADIQPVFQQNSFFETVLGWRIFFDFVGLAMCSGLYITPLNTAMQHYAPLNKTGQVIACSNVMDAVAMVGASALIIALQAYKVSVPAIYGIVATTGFVIAVWLYFTRKTQAD